MLCVTVTLCNSRERKNQPIRRENPGDRGVGGAWRGKMGVGARVSATQAAQTGNQGAIPGIEGGTTGDRGNDQGVRQETPALPPPVTVTFGYIKCDRYRGGLVVH